MRSKTFILIAGVVAVLIIAATGMAIVNDKGENSDGAFTDARGRSVDVESTERILCIGACSAEYVSYFDAVDRIIALDVRDGNDVQKGYYQAFKDKFESLPKVNKSAYERIVMLAPTLVITSDIEVSVINSMQDAIRIPVYAVNADIEFAEDRDAWYDQIEALGKLFNEKGRAKRIVDGVKGLVSDIEREKVKGVSGYVCGMNFYGSGAVKYLRTTGDYLPFEYAGIDNVVPSKSAKVSKQPYDIKAEDLQALDFDYLVIDGYYTNDVVRELKDNYSVIRDKAAVRNGNVYSTMAYKIYGTQFDATLINCFYIASVANGEAYGWSFEEKANEVLNLFYGGKYTYGQMLEDRSGKGCAKLSL